MDIVTNGIILFYRKSNIPEWREIVNCNADYF